MKKITDWIDISVEIEDGMVHWPGDAPVKSGKRESMEKGGHANVTCVSMSAHTGTHVDAPLHFIKDGKDVTELSLDALIGKAKLFHIRNQHKITAGELQGLSIEKGDRVLFKTRNSESAWWTKEFNSNFVALAKGG